jgi:hypothetical protein
LFASPDLLHRRAAFMQANSSSELIIRQLKAKGFDIGPRYGRRSVDTSKRSENECSLNSSGASDTRVASLSGPKCPKESGVSHCRALVISACLLMHKSTACNAKRRQQRFCNPKSLCSCSDAKEDGKSTGEDIRAAIAFRSSESGSTGHIFAVQQDHDTNEGPGPRAPSSASASPKGSDTIQV